MVCISPPELTDIQISLFLDSEIDGQIVSHLRRCPYCWEKASDIARLQNKLKIHLYRSSCPTPDQLRDYHFDLLPEIEATAIAGHVSNCPHCMRELLLDYVDDVTPASSVNVIEYIRLLIAKLTEAGSGTLTPAYSLRESGNPQPKIYIYQAEDVQISLTVEDEPDLLLRKHLIGLISGVDTDGWQIYLWQAEQLHVTAAVDAMGFWEIADLPPGDYALILSGLNVKISIPVLQV